MGRFFLCQIDAEQDIAVKKNTNSTLVFNSVAVPGYFIWLNLCHEIWFVTLGYC